MPAAPVLATIIINRLAVLAPEPALIFASAEVRSQRSAVTITVAVCLCIGNHQCNGMAG